MSPPTAEVAVDPDGHGRAGQVTFDCIDIEVQHKETQGDITGEKGFLGVTVIIMPTGQPRVVLRIQHADGKSLDAIIANAEASRTVVGMLIEANTKAAHISAAAKSAVRQ